MKHEQEEVQHIQVHADSCHHKVGFLASTLKAPLANEILFGKLVGGGTAVIDVKNDEIVVACTAAPAAA